MRYSNLLFLLFLLQAFHTKAQNDVLFTESFSNGIPATWTRIDNDGQDNDSTALGAFFTSPINLNGTGWGPLAISVNNQTRLSAWSSSKHINTAVPADDWLISPPIIIDSFTRLNWEAASFNTPLSAYEVRISTDSVRILDFLANPAVFTSTGELANSGITYTEHSVMLNQFGTANDTIYVAFRNNGLDDFVLVVDDIEVSNWLSADIRLSNFGVPQSTCQYSGTDQISVRVNNNGLQSWTNIDLTLIVDTGAGNIVINETVPGPIDSGGFVTHTFTPSFNFNSPLKTFDIQVYVNEAGDQDHSNDTLTATVTDVEPSSIPYLTNLNSATDRLGWVTVDANNDGGDVAVFNGAGRSGSNCFGYLADGDNIADDWLFSTCLLMENCKTYTLDFYEKVGNFGPFIGFGLFPTPEDLEVWIGTSPNPDSMTKRLLSLPGLYDTADFVLHTTDFDMDEDGIFYIGYHITSDAEILDFLLIDDVHIRNVAPPIAGFTYTVNGFDITITNTSSGFVDSIALNMGDGTVLSGFPSPYTYAATNTYTICLTVFNCSGSNQVCQQVLIDGVGIENLPIGRAQLFPNPANNQLVLDIELIKAAQISFRLTDLTGRVVLQQLYDTSGRLRQVIDVSSQAEGIYIAELEIDGRRQTQKVVISR